MSNDKHIAPLAVVSMGCVLPGVDHFRALDTIADWETVFQSASPLAWSETSRPIQGRQMDDSGFDFKKFSIPPLFRKAVSRETRLALRAAEDALAGLVLPESLRDCCDQFCAIHLGSDAAYRNATKVGALRALAEKLQAQGCPAAEVRRRLDDYKQPLAESLGCSSHDRVGEMASSIPARIAHFAHTRGKCQTLDGADKGGLRLLQLAQDCFRYHDSQMAVLTSVQCFHHRPQAYMLLEQGVSQDACWLEGAISLVVCPLAVAHEQGWPVLTQLGDIVTTHDGSPQPEADHPAALYFAGANQVFCQIVEMVLRQHQRCEGRSFTGGRWQVNVAQTQSLTPAVDDRVAIVDYQPITGQGLDKTQFWQTLEQGEDALREHSAAQLNAEAFVRTTQQKLSTYIHRTMSFPAHSPSDVALKKPMMPAKKQRLDVTQLYALNSCHSWSEKIRQFERVAIIIASNLSLSADRLQAMRALWSGLPGSEGAIPLPELPSINHWSWYGACGIGTAQLLAQYFGISADCYAVEAACASSLAAVHDAVRALQAGRYDAVIVGGIETATLERDLVLCSAQMMLSVSRIRPFSQGADGFTPGDGGGFVMLTHHPVPRAIATIEAISGSCDSYSMTAPDPLGQALAIKKTLSLTAIDAQTVQYLEAHGTGTELGDRSEVMSLKYSYHRDKHSPLYIGSAKYNFGHCFAGAGALSLCKVLSAFEHERIPPTPVSELNVDLPLGDIPAEVPQQAIPWRLSEDGQRKAAINAFGTGGINYHLVIRQSS
ncbi:3-ketoacyl-ACP synthase [Prodigiosinella confusarubida]|uniref:3-ketoacyl-ACP synthase n=1 Tax=Serratia sp. (strain ATCC 39006) TaxID=104623 RepID=A0A2I5TP22_SERS3|nr:polyketide synthase [Serratia sp. ATCC 39006]AUH01986.1 3-ketoacyl-ACP synthase [Serratia sp. ATCC 39006]AUH06308.1 3-ketoacyl-ACP synthase [Serratia sp. ATCC 39006]